MNVRELFPRLCFPIEVCTLFYGNYPELTERVLASLWETMPLDCFNLRIGLNAVSDRTAAIAHDYAERHPRAVVIESPKNLFKYPMMRRLFTEPPIEGRWVLWLDDDSYFKRKDWWLQLAHKVESQPEVKMFGQVHAMRIGMAQVDKIRGEPWFQGRPMEKEQADGSVEVTFPTGGFWLIESDCLAALDWPSGNLQHNGGDYLLGEAVRQQAWPIAFFDYGVVINDSERRSPENVPAPY